MFADHAARGLLGSGTTIIRALEIYEARMAGALGQVMTEAANHIEHRGRRWDKAMRRIGTALEEKAGNTDQVFDKALRLARARDSARRAFEVRRNETFERLENQLIEFREGWTAPREKPWNERHPIWYAALMLVAGTIIGAVATDAMQYISPKPDAAPLPASSPPTHRT